MDTKHEELTAAEHAERAHSQGQTVVEYCRQAGLSVHALYSARRQLKEKGVLPGVPRRRSRRVLKEAGKFMTVSVAQSAPAVVCRLRHPSGWVVECAGLPDPSWMKDLTGERG
jgi:transposase-like protein